MASTYMDNYRKKCREEKDRKIALERQTCQQDVYQLSSGTQKHKTWSEYMQPAGCATAVLAIVLVGIFGPGALLVALLLWPILASIIVSSKNQTIDNNNDSIAQQIRAREVTCKERCAAFERECDKQIDAEVKRYKSEVSKLRQMYGGSVVTTPVVNWMCTHFDTAIKAADRGIYVKTITAELRYRVDATQLVILKKLPHAGTYSDTDKIIFDKGVGGKRYHNLPDLFHQIGFAQALAKQIEFEIIHKYPQDPVAPARGQKPKIKIDYDDTTMVITYMADNPNYRSAVSFQKGIK